MKIDGTGAGGLLLVRLAIEQTGRDSRKAVVVANRQVGFREE